MANFPHNTSVSKAFAALARFRLEKWRQASSVQFPSYCLAPASIGMGVGACSFPFNALARAGGGGFATSVRFGHGQLPFQGLNSFALPTPTAPIDRTARNRQSVARRDNTRHMNADQQTIRRSDSQSSPRTLRDHRAFIPFGVPPLGGPELRKRGTPSYGNLNFTFCLLVALLASRAVAQTPADANHIQAAVDALRRVEGTFAPDPKMAIFVVAAMPGVNSVILQGDVTSSAAKDAAFAGVKAAGCAVTDQITVLPGADLGDRVWGLARKSVINLRVHPFAENSRAMATQAFLGTVLRVWKRQTNAQSAWYLVQTPDDYVSWTDGVSFVPCTKAQADSWQAAPLLFITALEGQIVQEPSSNAAPVSDVVQCDLVKHVATEGDWFKVELPDGRPGYLTKTAATDFATWRTHRHLTPENIESTAKVYLGQPYVWGGISWRGMDCSGFTRMVYYLNGQDDLHRDANEQCRQGVEVPLDDNLTNLKKGDLLFFGRAAYGSSPERITHVAIYLQDKLFIQDEGNVHISSLDWASPLADLRHINNLLHVRRLFPEP